MAKTTKQLVTVTVIIEVEVPDGMDAASVPDYAAEVVEEALMPDVDRDACVYGVDVATKPEREHYESYRFARGDSPVV